MITRNLKKLLMSLCTFSLCVSSFATAQNEIPSLIALTPTEEVAMHTQRMADVPDFVLENSSLASAYTSSEDAMYLKRINGNAYYYLNSLTASGDNIKLHDGSLWFVHPSHRDIVKTWITKDPLFIKPIAKCFSFYSYVIQNRETQDIIEVSLLNPPYENGPYTHWITHINPIDRIIYLNDDLMWKINPKDKAFSKYAIGQRLIIGVNNKWRHAAYPHILINTGIYKAPYIEADFYP